MTHRVLARCAAGLILLFSLGANAQGLRAPAAASAAAPARPNQPQAADFIVAVVNSEPITNNEVRAELQRVLQQIAQQRRAQPETSVLVRQVTERLINDKAQLQFAREIGIRVDDAAVDQAEQGVAVQNQLSVAEMHRRIEADGALVSQFREQLREQLMLTRLREREVDNRVRVSDLEVDQYLQEQQAAASDSQEINIAQVLVAIPDGANLEQVAALLAKAQTALKRARAGEDFAALARELSDASDRVNGGQLGLRSPERYPPLFMAAVKDLPVGAISEVVRSGAGLHVLKVIDKRSSGMPDMTVTQTQARHILLRPGAGLSEAAALARLRDFKQRISAGQADFAVLAREHSQDGSAAQGGDLGWTGPGQFVPEFEEALNRLAPLQISEPVVSRFGVHLVQLMARRTVALSPREQREVVRNLLRDKKLESAYIAWAQEVRGRAYVELREPAN